MGIHGMKEPRCANEPRWASDSRTVTVSLTLCTYLWTDLIVYVRLTLNPWSSCLSLPSIHHHRWADSYHFYCKEGLRCGQIWPHIFDWPHTKIPMSKGHFRDFPACAWSLVLFPIFENSEIKNIITVSEAFMSRCQLNKAFVLHNFTQQCLTQACRCVCQAFIEKVGSGGGGQAWSFRRCWTLKNIQGSSRWRTKKKCSRRNIVKKQRIKTRCNWWAMGYGWEIEIINEVPSYMVTLNCGKSGPRGLYLF